jgi:hypothetical protein
MLESGWCGFWGSHIKLYPIIPYYLTCGRWRFNATSHTRLKGGAGPSSSFTLRLRDWRSMWVQDGCNIHMDSYMASIGSCFILTWIVFKNHFLEVGLTPNRETMALRTLTTVDLFYFYHAWRSMWIGIHWNSIWLRAQSYMTSHYTWGYVTTLHDLEVSWDGFWTLSFGLSQFHGHGSWLVCEVALRPDLDKAHVITPIYLNKFVVLYQFMYVHLNLHNVTLLNVTPSLIPQNPEELQLESPFMLSHFPPIYPKFLHQNNPSKSLDHALVWITLSSLSFLQCWFLCYSIMSHATLIIHYYASMLTLRASSYHVHFGYHVHDTR